MKEGHDTQNARSILLAIAAAVLYALSSPISKLLLRDGDIPPTMLAGLLYIGAGAGMLIIYLISRLLKRKPNEQPVGRGDLRYIIAMVALDIAAPILLMLGLSSAAAANVSLLNNFEIVATSLIALVVFKEAISKRLWAAIAFVTAASALLSFEDTSSLTFSWGVAARYRRVHMLGRRKQLHAQAVVKGSDADSHHKGVLLRHRLCRHIALRR